MPQVAHAYRRDGWDGPLLRCLLDLKTCAQRLKQPKELLAASLELAALQVGGGAGGVLGGGWLCGCRCEGVMQVQV